MTAAPVRPRRERLVSLDVFRGLTVAAMLLVNDPGSWSAIAEPAARQEAMDRDWNGFANRLGRYELPRLDGFLGGIGYRVPVPGAVIRDGAGHANVEAPGLTLRYTIDGSAPEPHSPIYTKPVPLGRNSVFKVAAFTATGRRGRIAGAAS